MNFWMGHYSMNRNQAIELIKHYPYKIGHLVGFDKLTLLHNDWIKDFIYGKEDITKKAHRGSYKTTCLAVALCLLIIIKPNDAMLFMRKTDTDITEVVEAVKKMLLHDVVQELVRILYEFDLILYKSTTSEINTNLQTSARGTSQLTGLGISSSLTGKHYERIFTDDIVNIKDRVSKAEREKTKLIYMELQNLKNKGGRIVNTGTTWHKEDAFSVMPDAEIHDCYSTGLLTIDEINDVRSKMTPTLFSANYELKHIASENCLFSNPKFIKQFIKGENGEMVSQIANGFAHIDARYEGDDTTAFTIIKQHKDGKLVGYGKMFDKHVNDCKREIYTLHELYQAGTIAVETNADKGYLARDLNADGKPTMSYHESQNKFIKISTYLYKYWDKIHWIEETDPNYINQILDYQEGQGHDDCADSASSLIRIITNGSYTKVTGKRPF